MTTIAELKAEIESYLYCGSEYPVTEEWVLAMIKKGVEIDRQSLSQKIAEDVAGCMKTAKVANPITNKSDTVYCKDMPKEQKCQGCKRELKLKAFIDGTPAGKESEWGKENL